MNRLFRITLALIFLSLCACATRSSVDTSPTAAQDPPFDKNFSTIIFSDIESTPQIEADYPEAAGECLSSAISQLIMKKKYKTVENNNKTDNSASTLLVKVKINEMRLVGTAARIWWGAFAGSSYMNMQVEFIDVSSGSVLRTKDLSSSNNAFAAAWTSGANDHSLPSDMGKIIAEYITAIVPAT